MADDRRQLGAWGEDQAAALLVAKGLRLRERNWRCRHGEIDLIMEDGATLVFVEVRTRRGAAHGSAHEAFSPRKCAQVLKVCELYLQALEDAGSPWGGPCRIDAVAVSLVGGQPLVDHLEAAISA